MEAKQFDAAVAAYNQVLEIDPGNVAAHTGKSNAITARTVAEAAAGAGRAPTAPAHGFVAGRTEAKGREASAGLVGFEEGGVAVKRATQAAELPGKIHFETIPAAPQPGERFSVSAYLRNEGSQPIQLASMLVATTVDGRTQKGRVPLRHDDGRPARPRPRLPGPRPAAPGGHERLDDRGVARHLGRRDVPQHAVVEVAAASG